MCSPGKKTEKPQQRSPKSPELSVLRTLKCGSRFGLELQREAADVALGAGATSDRREASEHRGLLAEFRRDLCRGVTSDV
jgi:hypothetical protein